MSESVSAMSVSSESDACLNHKKCDRVMMIFYLLLLILVLILVGNVIQTGKSKGVTWTLFSFTIVLGLIALFFIFKGGKLKKFGVPALVIVNMLLLFIALLVAKPTASLGDKFGAHIANILVAIAVCASVFLTK
jgi:peptidoglycan/LPS O-acetylase OafA/YrhL